MNKSYCSIYNETTGTYVAVQETARAKGKRSSSSVAVCAASLLVASTMGLAAGDAVANSVTFNDQQVWGGSVNKSGVAYTNATPQGNLIASDTELNIPGATQEAGDPAGSIGEYIKQSILMGNGASFATVGGKYGIYDRFERVVAIGSKAAVAQPGDVFDVTVLGASAIAGSYDHRFNNGTQLPGAWTDTNSLRGATAIGGSAKALSSRATALGYQSEARGIGTIAIGSGAIAGVSATNNTGTGDVANAIAIGNASNASAASSVAIGNNTGVTVAGGVALGEGSQATIGANVAGYDPKTGSASADTSPTWKATNAAVSVGKADGTLTRQITGVAAGTVATDAVNVAQLKAAASASKTKVTEGSNIVVSSTTGADGSETYTVKTAQDLAVNTVTTGNTTISSDGLTINGGPSVTTTGINAGGNKITNVAAGTNSTDAVNFAQLQAVVAGSASKSVVAAGTNVASVTKTVGGTGEDIYTVNADATSVEAGSTYVTVTPGSKDASNVTKYNVDLSAQTKKDIADGAEAADVVAKKGLTFAGDNSSTSDAIKLGETLAITGDSNITTEAAGTGLQVKLNTELKDLTSVTTTDTAGNKTVTNGSGITITPAGGNAVSLTTAGLNNGGNTITNVGSAGTLNATNSNAATGADVYNAIHGTDGLLDTATFGLKAQDNSTVTKKLNNTVSVVGGHTGAGTTSAKNIKTVINATGELEIQMAETPEFASVTVGATGAQTQLSSTGANQLQIGSTGAKPITVNAATGVITGLSNTTWNGTATTGRAATEDQLQAVHDAAKATADAAVQYDAKAGGGINKNSVTLAGTTGTAVTKNANGTFTDMSGGTALNNVASAGSISDVNNAYKAVNAGDLNNQVAGLTSKGLKFAANSGTDYTAALGSTVSVKGAAANTDADKFDAGKNIMTSVDASGNILVAMAKDLKANSVTVGATGAQTQLSSTGANQLQIGSTGAKPITVNAATGVITGLSNTTWNGTATTGRAATEDQLQAVHDAAKATADAAVQYDAKAGGGINKNSVTLAGTTGTAVTKNANGTFTDMSGGTALNNVASAGSISDVNNAYKAVNAGDLNNQVAGLTSKGLKFAANSGTDYTAALGSTVSVKGAAANTDADKFDAGKNIMTSVDASGNILVAMAKDLKADSVSTGATTINNDGLTITGGPSVTTTGINAGSKAITNVADGTVAADSKDAVTGGQLYGTADSVKTILGGNAALGADGKLTMSNIGGTGKGTIDEAVKAAYDKAGEAADAAKKHTTVVAGQNVTVTEGTNADGGKEYTVAVKDDIELTSVTTGATKMDTTGVTIKNADPAKTVSLTADGLNNGGNKITNVADGAVAANSKDAVTGGQLYSTNTQVAGNTAALGGGAKFDSASNTFTAPVYNVTDANGNAKVVNDVGSAIEALNQGFKVTSAATGSGTVSGTATTAVKSGSTMTYVAGDNIALTQDGMKFTIATNKNVNFDKVTVGDVVLDKDNGIDAGNKQITNVGDGVNPGDAVNKKQLEAAINGNKEGLNALQQQIGQVSADANAGAASAMATAGLPQAYTPGKSMIAAAGSVYKGATAQAIGISTITENGKWVFKGSVNVNNRGYAGATVGVGYQW